MTRALELGCARRRGYGSGALVVALCAGCAPSAGPPSRTTAEPNAAALGDAADVASAGAPGAPGAPARWAPAQKSFLGTARSGASRLYFSGHGGALTELFYPELDTVQSVGLRFLVADAERGFADDEADAPYTATRPDAGSLRWEAAPAL